MKARAGFTLIETMVVIAVIGILAAIALPSIQARIVRGQVIEGVQLADIAKVPIAAAWAAQKALPPDNAAAGLPDSGKIVGNYVASLTVEGGAIQLRFGNHANGALQGKTLSLRPAVIPDAAIVPIAWVCGNASAPTPMSVEGVNRTDVPERFLPLNCRAG